MLTGEKRAPTSARASKSDKLLSPTECAAMIGYSVRTLANWRWRWRQGDRIGPPWLELPTGAVRYPLAGIVKWLKGRS